MTCVLIQIIIKSIFLFVLKQIFISNTEFISKQEDTRNIYTDYFEKHVSLKLLLKTYDYLKTAKPLKDWVVRDKTFSMDDFLIGSKHLNIPMSL